MIRPQRVCQLEAVVRAAGETIRPYLTYLPGLADLPGRLGPYVEDWVRQFYASLWVSPDHRFIHYSFGGRDYRLFAERARELLHLHPSETQLHQLCYGDTEPPRRPHGGEAPSTELVRPCFTEPFGEGSSHLPRDLMPVARVLNELMRRTLLPRVRFREGDRMQAEQQRQAEEQRRQVDAQAVAQAQMQLRQDQLQAQLLSF